MSRKEGCVVEPVLDADVRIAGRCGGTSSVDRKKTVARPVSSAGLERSTGGILAQP